MFCYYDDKNQTTEWLFQIWTKRRFSQKTHAGLIAEFIASVRAYKCFTKLAADDILRRKQQQINSLRLIFRRRKRLQNEHAADVASYKKNSNTSLRLVFRRHFSAENSYKISSSCHWINTQLFFYKYLPNPQKLHDIYQINFSYPQLFQIRYDIIPTMHGTTWIDLIVDLLAKPLNYSKQCQRNRVSWLYL